jgi:Zn-dependent membrane protease YugP
MTADAILYFAIIAISLISVVLSGTVNSTYDKKSKIATSLSGYDAARLILDKNKSKTSPK